MSIIFQTLNKMQAASGDERLDQVETIPSSSGPQTCRDRLRKNILKAGVIAGVIIVFGVVFVFGFRSLAAHLNHSSGEAVADQNTLVRSTRPTVEASTDAIKVNSTSPKFMAPDATLQSTLSSNTDPPSNKDMVASNLPRSPAPAAVHMDTIQPSEPDLHVETSNSSDPIPSGPSKELKGEDLHSLKQTTPVSKTHVKQLGELASTEVESLKIQKARMDAIEKTSRISRLVAQIEGALTASSSQHDRIEYLLSELEKLKPPGSAYVEKLRAYWLLKENKYDQARVLLEKIATADDEDVEVGINLAVIDIRTGNAQTALHRLQRLKVSYPENTRIAELILKLR
jgi:hypothetical protein